MNNLLGMFVISYPDLLGFLQAEVLGGVDLEVLLETDYELLVLGQVRSNSSFEVFLVDSDPEVVELAASDHFELLLASLVCNGYVRGGA